MLDAILNELTNVAEGTCCKNHPNEPAYIQVDYISKGIRKVRPFCESCFDLLKDKYPALARHKNVCDVCGYDKSFVRVTDDRYKDLLGGSRYVCESCWESVVAQVNEHTTSEHCEGCGCYRNDVQDVIEDETDFMDSKQRLCGCCRH